MVDGNCILTNVIYRAKLITSEKSKQNVGSSGLSFKSRYTRHKCSFNNSNNRLKTALSKYTLDLKDRNKDFSINRKISTNKKQIQFKTWLNSLQYEKTRDLKTKLKSSFI